MVARFKHRKRTHHLALLRGSTDSAGVVLSSLTLLLLCRGVGSSHTHTPHTENCHSGVSNECCTILQVLFTGIPVSAGNLTTKYAFNNVYDRLMEGASDSAGGVKFLHVCWIPWILPLDSATLRRVPRVIIII